MKNIFYLIVFLATLYATFAHAQDTLGLEYVNTRPETITLKDGSKLRLVDEWWKYLQVINQVNVDKTYLIRKGSVGLFTLFQLPDTINSWEVMVIMKKHDATTPPVPADDTIKVDAQEATFAGTWIRGITPAPGWYKKTIAFSNATGATMTYNFTGTGIQLWAERKAPPHGSGTITITQGTTIIKSSPVNFNVAPYGLPVLIFDSGPVPRGNYTLTLKVGSGYNLADFFIVKQ